MTFEDVKNKTHIIGFTPADETMVLSAMKTAYDGSVTAKTMFEDWIATASNTIDIKYVAGVFQAFTKTGRVEVDPTFIKDLSYINDTGTPVLHSFLGALVHEFGHALHGTRDNISATDYQGDNVKYVNQIWKELSIDREISYVAQAESDLHKVGYHYTNKAAIDAARTLDGNQNSSALGASKDLLVGGSSANILQSGAGDDFLVGAGGDDILKGGAGKDVAVYFGSPLDYDIRQNNDSSWTVKNVRGAKDSGADKLENVEVVQFDTDSGGGKQTYELKKHGLTFQTDFALVIDTTGSMGSSIGSVKAQASALLDAAFASGKADARIGVVGFKDTTIGESSSVILPFTDHDDFSARKSAAISAINSIGVGGGGDLPETAFDGLSVALDGSMGQWRAGAAVLRIALFTDASAKDGSLAGRVTDLAKKIGATIETHSSLVGDGGGVDTFDLTLAKESLNAPGDPEDDELPPFIPSDEPIEHDATTARVQIFTIFTGPDGTDVDALEKIANDNGGKFLPAGDNEALVKALFEIINLPPDAGEEGKLVKGTTKPDILTGEGGNDTITGLSGNDTLIGAGGDDSMTGNSGRDSIIGSEGNDLISGGTGRDTVDAGAGSDTVTGGKDNDNIFGGAGNDHIAGNSGRDKLYGGSGNDWLDGASGADWIYGDEGSDTLAGGGGDDRFFFSTNNGEDIIVDFSSKSDVIRIQKGVADIITIHDILSLVSSDISGDAYIDLGGGNGITLKGIMAKSVTVDYFDVYA